MEGIGRWFAGTLALAGGILAFGAAGASGWEYVTGPPKVVEVAWNLPYGIELGPKQRRFEIYVDSGFCSGEPHPVFDHFEVAEKPKSSRRPRGAAVITAYIRFPAPTEVRGEVREGEPSPACAGLGYGITGHVRLKRPAARVALFDGHATPPRRVHLRP